MNPVSKEEGKEPFQKFDLEKARKFSGKEPVQHQADALKKLSKWYGEKKTPHGGILVLPTGAGKTFTAVRFLHRNVVPDNKKIIWLAHTHHLLEQALSSIYDDVNSIVTEEKDIYRVRVVSGTEEHYHVNGIEEDDDVLIITIQSLVKAVNEKHSKIENFLEASNGELFVVYDEAHHAPAPSYSKLMTGFQERFADMSVLGLTATPTHQDENREGFLEKIFPQRIIYQATLQKLQSDNILAKPILEKADTKVEPKIDEGEYQSWLNSHSDIPDKIINELAENRKRNKVISDEYAKYKDTYGKTIIFADRWYQCECLSEFLQERGIKAGTVYSYSQKDDRDQEARKKHPKGKNSEILDKFKNNELDVLINVRMLTEGTDVPDVQSVFLTRQTTSPILLQQMVGRALRGPKFGGTDEAYIVSFIDEWKEHINWAEFDQIIEGEAIEDIPEYQKRPPLRLVSIELVRLLSRQMDSGENIATCPFITLLPLGWYVVEYHTTTDEDNGDNIEVFREFILVFEDQKDNYEEFIEYLKDEDLEDYSDESLRIKDISTETDDWEKRFFKQEQDHPSTKLGNNLFHIVRHMAQNNNTPPQFYEFEERKNHDLDKIAQEVIDKDLKRSEIEKRLHEEYYEDSKKYWKFLYPDLNRFKAQFDACCRYLENRGKETHEKNNIATGENPEHEEVDEDVKKQVKKRDGYKCLCCGYKNKRYLQIDHIEPKYYKQNNSKDNLQTLCKTCNNNRLKKKKKIDFRKDYNESLQERPQGLPTFEPPEDEKALEPEEWEKYLKRTINFFYECSAVKSIKINKQRGKYFKEWQINLKKGNDPQLLNNYLDDLYLNIYEGRRRAGVESPETIVIHSPDHEEIVFDGVYK